MVSEAKGERQNHAADRKSTRLNSSHLVISYAVFCLKKKKCRPSAPPLLQPNARDSPRLRERAFAIDGDPESVLTVGLFFFFKARGAHGVLPFSLPEDFCG